MLHTLYNAQNSAGIHVVCQGLCVSVSPLYAHVMCTSISSAVLPNSLEYQAAMELEMWKLSEEENYREQLKSKEVAYLNKLGEEWRKREAERQKIFTQKVALFSSCMYQVMYCLCIYMYNACKYTCVHTIWNILICDPHTCTCTYLYPTSYTYNTLQVESYNGLEKKLQNALHATQQHHQELVTKEIEV